MLKSIVASLLLLTISLSSHAEGVDVHKVAEGVYVHHGAHEDIAEGYQGDICNLSFIVGSKGVAVIDTGGMQATGVKLLQAIRNITPLPILYVINTHVHPDHIYGNVAFAETGAQYVGHFKLPDAMELRKDSYERLNRNLLGDAFNGSTLIKPTILVKDTLTLDLGDRQLLLTAHPTAHTNTDLTIQDSTSQTLWTGDLLFVERTPSIDGDIKAWITLTEAMGKLNITQVVPGHGPVVKDYRKAFANQHRYLSKLLEDVRLSIKNGEMMENAMGTAAASERSNWVLFDIVNRRNVNLIYPALEWE
jgi:quinoprotein relay system zinc metallohydrolase 2